MKALPEHLQKYIVEQDLQQYTAQDHAVWRYVLRQLKHFLTKHAHSSYLDGLAKTGISIDRIPSIADISSHLEKFGWRALPVSGFIPPAAFMELQSLSVLPIASDMRSIDHLLYTPAPDIVHEAAGHAPIIADPEYAAYLKKYAQIAKKSIISKEDLELYKAIRELSDIKENPNSTASEIAAAEKKLSDVSNAMTFVSEAAELSRMNWWTAEYGLVGTIENPKIFGAGLLSSVGESKWCLSDKVIKIPLSLDCIKQTYDITEPQPQLFVARDFHHLSDVLEELAATMAYRTGGVRSLAKALQAASVNTVELDNGLQISGVLSNFTTTPDSKTRQPTLSYLQFSGPVQLSFQNTEIEGHGCHYHAHGYGTPLGEVINCDISQLSLQTDVELIYASGVTVKGQLVNRQSLSDSAHILSFVHATCVFKEKVLFKPEWGTYDILTGHSVTSVFGGPADRTKYGDVDDFVANRVPKPIYTNEQKIKISYYQKIRDLRETQTSNPEILTQLFDELKIQAPHEWLMFIEILELCHHTQHTDLLAEKVTQHLHSIVEKKPELNSQISEGIHLSYAAT